MIVPLSELAVDRRKSVGILLERGERAEHIRMSRSAIVEGSRGESQFTGADSPLCPITLGDQPDPDGASLQLRTAEYATVAENPLRSRV